MAEGVEDAATVRDLLRRLGCDVAQGYLFARPVPAEAASGLLAADSPWQIPALVVAVERAALWAWPPRETRYLRGWLLRASGPLRPRRVNSAQTLAFDDPGRLEPAIAEAEAWYAARGLPACFQLTEAAAPPGLDAALAERGYARESESLVMLGYLTNRRGGRRRDGRDPPPPAPVLGARRQWRTRSGDPQRRERAALLARIRRPHRYALVTVGGEPAAGGAAPSRTARSPACSRSAPSRRSAARAWRGASSLRAPPGRGRKVPSASTSRWRPTTSRRLPSTLGSASPRLTGTGTARLRNAKLPVAGRRITSCAMERVPLAWRRHEPARAGLAAAAAVVILGTAGEGYAATVDETVLMLNFKAADSNGDGYVTEDEIAAETSAAAFSSLDKNHDGFLTPDELGPHDAAAFAAIDTDHDGKLSFVEVMNYKLKLLTPFDANHDGRWSIEEVRAFDASR